MLKQFTVCLDSWRMADLDLEIRCILEGPDQNFSESIPQLKDKNQGFETQ